MADSDAESLSQGFEPQEDDEETLWEVIEITGEKPRQYKVRWKGIDPATLKPWKQSWVPKKDCTDDLVMEWKRKQKEKGQRKSTASKHGRRSTSTTKPNGSSATDSRSTETVTPTNNKLKRENHAIEEDAGAANGKGRKRKIAEADSAHNSANVPNTKTFDQDGDGSRKPPPKKRRKIQVEVVKSEPEPEDRSLLVEEESHPIRVARGKLAEKDEESEAEERMVEDALSENFDSPEPEEDIVPRKPPSRIAKEKSTNRPLTGKKPASSTITQNPPNIGRPKGRATEKQKEALSVDSNVKTIPQTQAKTNQRKKTTKQGPPLRTLGSVVSLTSDSDFDGPPPLDYSSINKYPPPTEERSVVWNGNQPSPAPSPRRLRSKPTLSPAALERLAQFDKEVLAEEEEEESQQPVSVQEVPKKNLAELDKGKGRASDPLFLTHNSSVVHSLAPGTSHSTSSKQQDAGQANEVPTTDIEAGYVMFKPNPLSVLHLASPSKEKVSSPVEDHTVPKPQVATTRESSVVKPVSTTTTATVASNMDRRRKALKPSSKSYSTDIIPETEAEESQSQEITLPSKPGIDLLAFTSLQPQPPSTPGGRSTLKSRMKGRTPSRASSVLSDKEDHPKEKPLRPVRMLSPSVFHPHLPSILEPEPESSLPESISEAVNDSFKQGSSKVQNEIEQDGTMSSIEEFDSPEKQPGKVKKALKKDIVATTRDQKETASDIWESEVVQRGQQLAEAAKKPRNPRPKKMLDEIRAGRNRSGSAFIRTGDEVEKQPDSQNSIDKDGDADMVNASTAVVPPASGPRNIEDEDDSMTVEAMEEAYVDLHGGASVVDPILLRREEEESTQDLMMEFNAVHEHQRGMDLESGWNVEAVVEDHPASFSEKGKERAQDNGDGGVENMSKQVETHVAGINSAPVAQPLIEDADPTDQARPRSGSHASLSQFIKPTSPPHLLPVPDLSFHLVQADLNTVRRSLEAKLEEIASLQAQLASERAKNHVLQEEVLRLQPQIIRPNQLEATNNDKERVAELEEQAAQFVVEKAEWETERASLRASLESAERGKVDAAKDREFFREQYAQASGYVSSVRDENRDLEKRVKIAEEQASSGVALVKATFKARIAELDKNVASWRMMAEFLVEKDKRTGNDDLRRRAAEQPELKRLCREQSEQLIHLQAELDDIREELDEKNQAYINAEDELVQWKTETARLNVELNEALIKLDRIGRGYTQNDSAGMDTDDSGHEFVYCCQWRTTNGDISEACREVFKTISDLEQHLFSGGHLHRT